jgi:hypothetical protein
VAKVTSARAPPIRSAMQIAPEMIARDDHAAHHTDFRRETIMTAYLISLALAGLVAIAVWEGFS